MSNGSYIMTYEIIGSPSGAYYKISSNPESWNAADTGTVFDAKGSNPYCVNMNGTVILSSGGNNNLYTNANNGTGTWSQISSTVGACYSRAIVPLSNGRLFVIGAGWNGSSLNNVTYGDMAGYASTAGGTQGTGGAKNTGGASASGGLVGTGGLSSTGGRSATSLGLGGTLNTGGVATTLVSSGGNLSAGGSSHGSGGATTGSTMKNTGGSQNTGGIPNTAGTTNAATGGLSASGGVQSTGKSSVGGSPSNGGTSAATPSGQAGSSPATGGAGQAVSQATNPGGCGCRVRGRDSNGFAAWPLALLTLSVLRRRRAPGALSRQLGVCRAQVNQTR